MFVKFFNCVATSSEESIDVISLDCNRINWNKVFRSGWQTFDDIDNPSLDVSDLVYLNSNPFDNAVW